MQYNKPEIRKNIIATAKQLFLAKGYNAVSMRDISKHSHVGLSNIYNYFTSKNAIFKEILHPLIQSFHHLLAEHNTDENTTIEFFTEPQLQEGHINAVIQTVWAYKEELQLLFLKSQGSEYENYEQEIAKHSFLKGKEYFKIMKQKYPYLHTDVTDQLLQSGCIMFVHIYKAIATSPQMSDQQVKCLIREYATFNAAGWKAIMQV